MSKLPEQHVRIKKRFKKILTAVNNLGKVIRNAGPIDKKTTHLIQLAGAAAIRSEGSVHSHTRRALEAGATTEEIYHTIILLTSTIGFPTVSAVLSWADDVILGKEA
ncbi:MAG TPA: alkylhydroperoxidase [Nitrospiraceae bacterium]|jgi:AhpD family alkylhydroperoxidase|nr:alkylhydroperoxidase [Nitrospiraceae bacterium]